ncbi:MAG: YcxB family protein [Anaerovoracaceae bacterium]
MDTYFKSETTNTMDSYNTLAKIIYYTRAGWLRFIILVFAILVAAIGIIAIYFGGFSPGLLTIVLLGLALPLLNARMVRKLARFMAKTSGVNGIIEYLFNDSSFTLIDGKGETETPYDQIAKIIESEKYYFIFLQSTLCHCITKGSFTQGNEKDFLPFLKDKCQRDTFFGTFPGKYK